MPGVEAGEIGPKVHGGMAAVDNGCKSFSPSVNSTIRLFRLKTSEATTDSECLRQGLDSPTSNSPTIECSVDSPKSTNKENTSNRLTASSRTAE